MPLLGTRIDDEKDKNLKYTPLWNQKATDKDGKTRFHGAFTGGFSAGYWGTVGSKEGFTPQTFRSSRKDRAKTVEQSVADFLDSEDYEEGVGGKTLTTKEEFSDEKKYSANLNVLKGKRGVSEIFDIPNTNTHFSTATSEVSKRRKGVGLSVLEDDDDFDVYNEDDRSMHDFELDHPSEKSSNFHAQSSSGRRIEIEDYSKSDVDTSYDVNNLARCSDGRVPLPGFILSKKITVNLNQYPPPILPDGYVPKKVFETALYTPLIGGRLDHNRRAEILGEQPLPSTNNNNNNNNVSRPSVATLHDFSGEKEYRYKKYLKGEWDTVNSGLSRDEKIKELEEFIAVDKKFNQIPELMQSRFTVARPLSDAEKQLEELKKEKEKEPKPFFRVTSDWAPHRLLCKRFGTLNPYEHTLPNSTPTSRIQNSVDSFLMDLSMNRFTTPGTEIKIEITPPKTEEEIELEHINQIPSRPSDISIFKAIFADDDEEEEE